MKQEDYFKIQIEMKLLEAGYYDREVWGYFNQNMDWFKKKFSQRFSKTVHGKKMRLSLPEPMFSAEELRAIYFRERMHPELFEELK